MSNILSNIALGFTVAASWENLFYCLAGVTVGTFVGVLPGLGPVATIAMLLPITFYLPPDSGIIMILGIYYGAQYGGSITSIVLKIPGESSTVPTVFDGYPMALQGRAGPALMISALGSFVAGCFSTLMIIVFAPVLASYALKFGPTEYFSLMVMGLLIAASLMGGSLLKAIGMVLLGLLFGLVGVDVTTGKYRLMFGFIDLADGIDFAVVVMGVYGFAEVICNLEVGSEIRTASRVPWRDLIPKRSDLLDSWRPMLRGTMIGSVLGMLPGSGATVGSFAAYSVEKTIAKDPSRFGKGAIEGVAAPEAANNAAAQASLVPTLSLGIPSNATMALIFAALLVHGIQPGPLLVTGHPDIFFGVLVSMWFGNMMLLVLNLPMIGIWIRFLTTPYRFLFPAIIVFCCIGVFSLASSRFDVLLCAGFGLLGYVFIKLECEPAPLLLGLILGRMMEEHLRRSLVISRGDYTVFLTEPISLILLVLAVVFSVALRSPERLIKVFKIISRRLRWTSVNKAP